MPGPGRRGRSPAPSLWLGAACGAESTDLARPLPVEVDHGFEGAHAASSFPWMRRPASCIAQPLSPRSIELNSSAPDLSALRGYDAAFGHHANAACLVAARRANPKSFAGHSWCCGLRFGCRAPPPPDVTRGCATRGAIRRWRAWRERRISSPVKFEQTERSALTGFRRLLRVTSLRLHSSTRCCA